MSATWRPAALAAGVVCLPAPALAGTPAAAAAQTEVLEALQFAVLLDMNFGRIAVGGAGGVVNLDPYSGGRVCDPALVCIGAFGASELQVSGSDANIQVTFDPTFPLNGPGDPIIAEPLFPGGSGAIVHLTGGSAVVKFGARLHINNQQVPGIYTGQFSVNLVYN